MQRAAWQDHAASPRVVWQTPLPRQCLFFMVGAWTSAAGEAHGIATKRPSDPRSAVEAWPPRDCTPRPSP